MDVSARSDPAGRAGTAGHVGWAGQAGASRSGQSMVGRAVQGACSVAARGKALEARPPPPPMPVKRECIAMTKKQFSSMVEAEPAPTKRKAQVCKARKARGAHLVQLLVVACEDPLVVLLLQAGGRGRGGGAAAVMGGCYLYKACGICTLAASCRGTRPAHSRCLPSRGSPENATRDGRQAVGATVEPGRPR